MKKHIDYDYAQKYVEGHGAGFAYNSIDGLLTCDFITTKSRIFIMYVNLVLFLRFIMRKFSIIWKS